MTIAITKRKYDDQHEVWNVSIHYLRPGETKKRRYRCNKPISLSRKSVLKWAERHERALLLGEVQKEEVQAKEVITFAKFAERFMTEYPRQRELRPSTVAQYRSAIDNHYVKTFGTTPIDEIGRFEFDKLASLELKGSTRNRLMSCLAAMLGVAEAWELRGPVPKVRRVKVDQREVDSYSEEELNALLGHAPTDEHRVIVLLGGDAGLRCGEIAGLQVGDIDLDGRVLTVRRNTWEAVGDERYEHAPKGRRSRVVPLSARLAEVLARVCDGCRPSDYVTTSASERHRRNQIKNRIRTCEARWHQIKTHKCPGAVHRLRHTCATRLMRTGVAPAVIRDLLGHSSIAMQDRYTHPKRADLRAAVDALDAGAHTAQAVASEGKS